MDINTLAVLVVVTALVLVFSSLWAVFKKANEPGWAALIPIYNVAVACKIAGKPLWWVLLVIIPPFGPFGALLLSISLARSFGKGTGFGILMAPFTFVFMPLLAFGDAKYRGPAG